MLGLCARALFRCLRHFGRDERGDEGVNKILIIALVAVPLVIVLIVFGGEIVDWFNEAWGKLTETDDIPDGGPAGGDGGP